MESKSALYSSYSLSGIVLMCSVDGAISSVLAAKESAMKTQISFAIAGKQLKAQEQQGEAVSQLLEAAAQLSKSIGSGTSFDAVG